ncbi:MAG: DUF2203 family protein, partial [Thermoanaerobaculia bacterium]
VKVRIPRRFSYEEALSIFPVVRDLTAEAVLQVAGVTRELEHTEDGSTQREALETSHQTIVEEWAREIESLGLEVKGPWLVDWDCGDGYYCWRYPEPSLAHFHGYDEGFANRVPIN